MLLTSLHSVYAQMQISPQIFHKSEEEPQPLPVSFMHIYILILKRKKCIYL